MYHSTWNAIFASTANVVTNNRPIGSQGISLMYCHSNIQLDWNIIRDCEETLVNNFLYKNNEVFGAYIY